MSFFDQESIDQLQSFGSMPRPKIDYSVANLYDAMERLGIGDRLLDPSFRPLLPHTKLVGTAVTVKVEDCESSGSYYEEFNRSLEAGKLVASPVLVAQSPETSGLLGSGIAYVIRRHYGFVGAVLEGMRDTDDLVNMKFPCYARTVSPRYQAGKLRGVSANEPVTLGGVTIAPGDLIVGDNDGVVAVPRDQLQRILTAVHEDLDSELAIFRDIDGGMSYIDAANRQVAGRSKSKLQ